MSTPFSDIYVKFNVLMEDVNLLSLLDQDDYEELLELFMSKAKSVYFKNCKKDLTDVNNTTKVFNEDLDEQEQWIIAESMRYIWLERKVYNESKLRDRIGVRDYQLHSPANLLDKLISLKKEAKKSLDEILISYSYDEFEGFD